MIRLLTCGQDGGGTGSALRNTGNAPLIYIPGCDGVCAKACSPQQRPFCAIVEDSLLAEKIMGTLEAASASLQPSSEREKEGKCEHTTSTPVPEREDARHSNEIAAEKRVRVEKEDATPRADVSFDETDHPIPARQRAVLQRVLGQWQKRTRKEEFTPKSEAYPTSLEPLSYYVLCRVHRRY